MPTSQTSCRCRLISLAFLSAILFTGLLPGCSDRKEIIIGYIGPAAGANGALLAAEQASAAGGVKGKSIRIIAGNSEQPGFDPGLASDELRRQKVKAIIDTTGTLSVTGWNFGRPAIVSTGGGESENLAIENPLITAAVLVADQLWQDRIVSVSVLIDQADRGYNDLWLQTFRKRYEQNRGVILKVGRLDSSQSEWEEALAQQVRKTLIKETRGLVVIAEAEVAGLACRQARLIRKKLPLAMALAEPALPAFLLEEPDKDLEGALVVKIFTSETGKTAYEQFAKNYQENFDSRPNLSAASAYDAVNLLVAAYRKEKKLAKGFAALAEYRGVLGTARYTDNAFRRRPELGRILQGRIEPIVTAEE